MAGRAVGLTPVCGYESFVGFSSRDVPEETIYSRRGEIKVGDLVADRYEIASIIGEGGMGLVYKARHVLMKRHVALKMIRGEFVANQTMMQRFHQEAQAVSKLQHENIVTVYDFGVTLDGAPYLVMDYLDGRSLSDVIVEQGRIPLDEALEIFLQACNALQHAHKKGIIHRDFKSSNLMICKEGDRSIVKVVDFGMAKLMRPDSDSQFIQELTQTGEIFGSPLYMSPEQCRGQRLDERSDMYSLACVMYYALTGIPPFLGENVLDTLQKQIHDNPLPPHSHNPAIPADVEGIILKALRKNPDDRYQSVTELLVDLKAVTAGKQRVFVTKQFKKPEIAVVAPVKKRVLFSHNFETNMIVLLVLSGTVIAMTAYMTGQFVEEADEARDVNFWVERNLAGDKARQKGEYAKAEKLYTEAVIEATKFGKTDPRLAKSLVSLGSTYIADKKYAKAETQLKRATTILEKCYGPNCPELATVMLLMARGLEEQGRKKQAADMHKKAVALLEGSVGGRLGRTPGSRR